MSYHAHTPAEWAQMLSLAVGAYGALSVPYFLTVDADLADFDPRPAVRRACAITAYFAASVSYAVRCAAWDVSRSEAVYQLLQEWDIARRASREAVRDAAALVLLLTTSPKGAMA